MLSVFRRIRKPFQARVTDLPVKAALNNSRSNRVFGLRPAHLP